MFKRIGGELRGYLIDFDLAGLVGHDSHNLDRTGTMPFMALELLESVGPGNAPVLHAYAHDAEAVCWVVLWLGVQYAAGRRVGRSFSGWEMVDASTCCMRKRDAIRKLPRHSFTEPNALLQMPIRDILTKIRIHYLQKDVKEITGEEVPVMDVGGWMDDCNKAIVAKVCTAE